MQHILTQHHKKNALWFGLGGITALGFAPLFWWPLSLLGVASLFYLLKHQLEASKSKSHMPFWYIFKKIWLFGFGFTLLGLWWVGGSLRFTSLGPEIGFWLGGLAAISLSAVMALWFTLPILGFYALRHHIHIKNWFTPFLATGLWVAIEALRATTPYGFAWNILGYTLAGHDALMQPAALGGVWVLSAMLVFTAAAWVWLPRKKALCYIAIPLCLTLWGAWRLHTAPPLTAFAQVALIQPNVPQNIKWKEPPIQAATKLVAQIHKNLNAAEQKPQLIVLPETALTFIDPHAVFMQNTLAPHISKGAGFIYGTPYYDNAYYNSIVALSDKSLETFHKEFLVPFGETIPFYALLPQAIKPFLPKNSYAPGQKARIINTPIGKALPIICFESVFPFAIKAAQKQHTPKFIINVTNDAWFDNTTGPDQHLAIAKIRSVETGLSQIRVANTGSSALIDGYGRIEKRSKKEQTTQINSPIFEQVF